MNKYNSIKIIILTGYKLGYCQKLAEKVVCYSFISKQESTKSFVEKLKGIVHDNKKYFYTTKVENEKIITSELKILKLFMYLEKPEKKWYRNALCLLVL